MAVAQWNCECDEDKTIEPFDGTLDDAKTTCEGLLGVSLLVLHAVTTGDEVFATYEPETT